MVAREKDRKAKELIKLADLPEEYLDRYPSQLSGTTTTYWCSTCLGS